jgi:hypothetical protein
MFWDNRTGGLLKERSLLHLVAAKASDHIWILYLYVCLFPWSLSIEKHRYKINEQFMELASVEHLTWRKHSDVILHSDTLDLGHIRYKCPWEGSVTFMCVVKRDNFPLGITVVCLVYPSFPFSCLELILAVWQNTASSTSLFSWLWQGCTEHSMGPYLLSCSCR